MTARFSAQERESPVTGNGDGSLLRGTSDQRSPSDADSILGKIDRCVTRPQAGTPAEHATRRLETTDVLLPAHLTRAISAARRLEDAKSAGPMCRQVLEWCEGAVYIEAAVTVRRGLFWSQYLHR